jgi:antitoxin component of MazEF toxin-antitoxin module
VNISPNAKCVRLQNNTEIIVAPKPRNAEKPKQIEPQNNEEDENNNKENNHNQHNKTPINICILRIQPTAYEDTMQRVVYISERTFTQLNWKPQDLISIQPISKFSVIPPNDNNNNNNNNILGGSINKENQNTSMLNSNNNNINNNNRHSNLLSRSQSQMKEKENDQPTHFLSNIAYCCVLPSRDIEDGFVIIPADIRKQLKVPNASRVKLSRNPNHSFVLPNVVYLNSIKWKFTLFVSSILRFFYYSFSVENIHEIKIILSTIIFKLRTSYFLLLSW